MFAQNADTEYFEKNVRPVFAAKCQGCHGAKTQTAGLNLSTSAGLDRVVVKGDSAQSKMFRALSYTGEIKMPPSGKLAANEIAAVKAWIEMGAPWPKNSSASQSKEHWAYQLVRDPALPAVKNAAWVQSPIDRFILAKLEAKNLRPAATASKLTLLRRVHFDLIGLPPTPDDIRSFLADSSPNAYAKVVDHLLASPQYGEHWGRHWLDVARYADSTGMDEDHIYPYAWRYRDYVVKAFNDDLPYNRFVMEQIAGDLLPEPRTVATGFLALGPKPLAQQDRVQMIYDVVDEQIDTTSKAFMGTTIACARCHDHKFDPILTKDYYSLASIFASTLDFRNLGRPGAVSYIYYAPLDAEAYARYQTHRWRMYGKQLEMEDALAEDLARENALARPKMAESIEAAWKTRDASDKWVKLFGSDKPYARKWSQADAGTIKQVAQEYAESYNKTARKWDGQLENWRKRYATEVAQDRDLPARPKFNAEEDPFFDAVTFHEGPLDFAESARVAELRREWQVLVKSLPPEPPMASAVTEGAPVDQHVFLHGDPHSLGDPVAKTFPVVLAGNAQKPVTKGSGRLELAQWLAGADHPLIARVMVNRIWQWHFGEALVRTPNNWGTTGDVPVHGELLDYLARRFVESDWSIKAMHRMILLSSTYQESSQSTPEMRDVDPANRLCGRFNRTRMSIEQIRDSILALDGRLDNTIGGSLLPAEGAKRPKVDPEKITRRTLYIPVRRGSVPAVLSAFDFGDATSPGDGRARTNVAPQALFLMNSGFVQTRSEGFAKRLLDDASLTDPQRVERAYLMALTRNPDAGEVDAALSYIANLEKRLPASDAHTKAWQSFCHVLVATNEFIYLN
jgi:cytochrome c553